MHNPTAAGGAVVTPARTTPACPTTHLTDAPAHRAAHRAIVRGARSDGAASLISDRAVRRGAVAGMRRPRHARSVGARPGATTHGGWTR